MPNTVTVTIEYKTGQRIGIEHARAQKIIQFDDTNNVLTKIARQKNALEKILVGYEELSVNSAFGMKKFWLSIKIASVCKQRNRSDNKLKKYIYRAFTTSVEHLTAFEVIREEYGQDRPERIDAITRYKIEKILDSDQSLIDPEYMRITAHIRDGAITHFIM